MFLPNEVKICQNVAKDGEHVHREHVSFDTVDEQNPAPPRMMIIPLFMGF